MLQTPAIFLNAFGVAVLSEEGNIKYLKMPLTNHRVKVTSSSGVVVEELEPVLLSSAKGKDVGLAASAISEIQWQSKQSAHKCLS